jgi:hypothetical protein
MRWYIFLWRVTHSKQVEEFEKVLYSIQSRTKQAILNIIQKMEYILLFFNPYCS